MLYLIKLVKRLALTNAFILCLAACHNYYMVRKAKSANINESAASVDSLQQLNRAFILRNGGNAFLIRNASLNEDKTILRCKLEPLPFEHQLHLTYGHKGKYQYKKGSAQADGLLSEVHFFTQADPNANYGDYNLDLNRVEKIEVIERDRKRTTNSYVLGAIGTTLGVVAVTYLIILATKSSCPFVSAWNGNEFILQGEIYGGAIYPQLVRDDYLSLKLAEQKGGELQIKISNELQEIQHTDLAELLVVHHDKDTRIVVAENGQLYSISDPKLPGSAVLNNQKNVLPALLKAEDNYIAYMDDSSMVNARNDLLLSFKRPSGMKHAKLVLTLKNSYWLDMLFGEMAKNLGTAYAGYVQDQKKRPAADLRKWISEQQIPLQVSAKYGNEWQVNSGITTVGPLAFREMVIPLTLTEEHSDSVQVKLSSGFLFWEIDKAEMDFSPDNEVMIERLTPVKAVDENNKNVLHLLAGADNSFHVQPDVGNVTTITFRPGTPANKEYIKSYFLHSRGYYEHKRSFQTKPDLQFLMQFKQPGAMSRYGLSLYNKVNDASIRFLAETTK